MISKKQCISLMILATLFGVSATAASALERRMDKEIPINELFKEIYQADISSNNLNAVLWMPFEYWKASLSHDKQVSPEVKKLLQSELGSVFILAVVQAESSPQTNLNFNFFPEETVRRGLKVIHVSRDGQLRTLKLVEKNSNFMNVLKETIRPMLSQIAGQMGDNFWLFVYSDIDSSGRRLVSPYEPGELRVSLGDRRGLQKSKIKFEFPFNSLFVPRMCPNGKPAHVSWKYCPWDGTRLSN
ncbi:hypothetical protein DP113_04805 [Brasilonema octagenarum UFV-E1]|uniref:Uncharacterized protein n=2 Tax=Bromeliae group (in: Brasilonema) TaxID=3398495 RepID=A0A856MCA2_9CYAN|nr:hypothetical protein DP114_04855 [Brasilonema sennae CENA114]QDL13685.1 hypothetical protein DP113_04805 [Brasilonema octagenarum UFV-E1]